MTAEVLSIIAVCISGVTAVCSATIPAILSYNIKKAELKDKKEREAQEEYEAKFEKFYQEHLKVLNDFSELYIQWIGSTDVSTRYRLINFVYKISNQFQLPVRKNLLHFVDTINEVGIRGADEEYQKCLKSILWSYGLTITADTPNFFTSDILKIVLKDRFDELQKSTSKDYSVYDR